MCDHWLLATDHPNPQKAPTKPHDFPRFVIGYKYMAYALVLWLGNRVQVNWLLATGFALGFIKPTKSHNSNGNNVHKQSRRQFRFV